MSKHNSSPKVITFALLFIIFTCFLAILVLISQIKPSRQSRINNQSQLELNRILSTCQKSNLPNNCYQEEFAQLTKIHDIKFSKKVLEATQKLDPTTRNCHTIAHAIAKSSVEKNPENWQKLLSNEDPNFCSGGFFHGIIERHSGLDPNFSIESSEIQNLCLTNNNNFTEGSCLHALGHIVLIEKNGKIEESTKVCAQINSSSIDECYSGIFMENMVRRNLQEHSIAKMRDWNLGFANELENLCLKQNSKSAKGCWGEMGFIYAKLSGDDPYETFKLCSKTPYATYQENCYKHAAFKIPLTANTQSKVNEICKVYSKEENIEKCVKYVLYTLINNSPSFNQRANDFCISQIDNNQKEKCFRTLGSILNRRSPRNDESSVLVIPE